MLRFSSFVLFGVMIVACGGSDTTGLTGDGGPSDGNVVGDRGTGSDGSGDTGSPVDASDARGGDDAASDAPAETGGGTCTRPSDCTSSAPYCCGTWMTGAGEFPNCPVETNTYTVGCKATCNSSFALTCNAQTTARLCGAKSDCTEPGYTECCDFGSDAGTSPFVCISPYAKPYTLGCK
jgi:hypothetical protein